MARFTALLAAAMLPQLACGISLSSDNSRDRYRNDPSMYGSPWEPPILMSGVRASKELQTDMTLHSSDPTKRESWLDYLYPFAWELEFEGAHLTALCRRWWWMAIVASSLYLIGLWAGAAAMKDRKAFDLKAPLALWNLFLAVFSFIGTLRTAPYLFMMLRNYGFEYTVCRAAVASYGSSATGLWVAFFIFSKYFELIDTIFLVLRKKQVPFLHWYHHCSVLLYCWHSYVFEMPTGIYFSAMNYAVHAVMYFYYFLAAVLVKPPKWARAVTVFQISQMIIGIIVTLKHLHTLTYEKLPNCDGHIPNLAGALCMYASYFILFAQFFVRRYVGGKAKAKEKKLE